MFLVVFTSKEIKLIFCEIVISKILQGRFVKLFSIGTAFFLVLLVVFTSKEIKFIFCSENYEILTSKIITVAAREINGIILNIPTYIYTIKMVTFCSITKVA